MRIEGNPDSPILFVSDFPGPDEHAEGRPIAGFKYELLINAMLRAGLGEDAFCIYSLYPEMPFGGKARNLSKDALPRHVAEFKVFLLERLRRNPRGLRMIVPLGSLALKVITGETSVEKFKLSLLTSRAEYGGMPCLPLPHPRDVLKDYTQTAYLGIGAKKLAGYLANGTQVPQRKIRTNPSLEDTLSFLDRCLGAREIAIDLETGRGQINTVGFSVSPTEAIAIGVLPQRFGPESYFRLWRKIAQVCESPVPKIAQNALYELMWLSRYGITLKNVIHDTMWAMKFLNPEQKAGLDNVGRIYTPFPYWKDDNELWEDVRDWTQHYVYNGKDTTGTHWAYVEQRKELTERGLDSLYYGFVQKFFGPISEMCTRGLLVDAKKKEALTDAARRKVANLQDKLTTEFQTELGREVNPRSPVQLHKALKDMGMKLPTKVDKATGVRKETTDKVALAKLKKKYPKQAVLDYLMRLSKENKMLSSYLDFEYHKDGRLRYMLNAGATETGRWNGTKDAFGFGFNPQTVPKSVRSMFLPEPGKFLVQIDLKQAESRYVAWDAPEPTLQELILNGRDIHKYVAAKIFSKDETTVSKQERQLGKKSGHAANYGVGPMTFADQCLLDGIVITPKEAEKIISGYYEVFPGIRKRQERIRNEIQRTRKLTTPIGRERIFHGRLNDSTYREAFAFEPQSVIPDITNHLMLYLYRFGDYDFHLQVHDSLLLSCEEEKLSELFQRANDLPAWHPEIDLPGGKLVIPIDIEVGPNWGDMASV